VKKSPVRQYAFLAVRTSEEGGRVVFALRVSRFDGGFLTRIQTAGGWVQVRGKLKHGWFRIICRPKLRESRCHVFLEPVDRAAGAAETAWRADYFAGRAVVLTLSGPDGGAISMEPLDLVEDSEPPQPRLVSA
jgi:hypothetical protein